jgi:hypothetical protein
MLFQIFFKKNRNEEHVCMLSCALLDRRCEFRSHKLNVVDDSRTSYHSSSAVKLPLQMCGVERAY